MLNQVPQSQNVSIIICIWLTNFLTRLHTRPNQSDQCNFTGSNAKLQQAVWHNIGSGSESERNCTFKSYADQWNASLFHFRGLLLDDVLRNSIKHERLLEEFTCRLKKHYVALLKMKKENLKQNMLMFSAQF